MKRQMYILLPWFIVFLFSCSSKNKSQNENAMDTTQVIIDSAKPLNDAVTNHNGQTFPSPATTDKLHQVIVPQFSILKREREDYNDCTPRTRFHIKTPQLYTESELNIIADSLLRKERYENDISEIWVNYYLPNKTINHSNSYGLSIRLRTEHSSTIFQRETTKLGYNPPKARDLSNANIREKQLWGAFDQGQSAGYEAGYKDGKKRRKVYFSFDPDYPTNDEWIEQSYKQGYEVGYLDGFDDAGGTR